MILKSKKNSKMAQKPYQGPRTWKILQQALRKNDKSEGGGVCSDMSQVYNNFCVINDLKVKGGA
jgi:hypothetical protein